MLPNHCFMSPDYNAEANEIDIMLVFNSALDPAVLNSGVTRTWWNVNDEESLTVFNPYFDTDWLLCTANVTSIEKLPLGSNGHTTWQINNNIAIDSRNERNSTSDIEECTGFLLSGGLLYNAVNKDWNAANQTYSRHSRFGNDAFAIAPEAFDQCLSTTNEDGEFHYTMWSTCSKAGYGSAS